MNELILKLHEEIIVKQKQIEKMQKEIDCLYKALEEQRHFYLEKLKELESEAD